MNTDQHRSTPSSKKQRQLIAIGCNELGIDAETRHEMLRQRFGADSSTRISYAQAADFLAELKGRGFTVRPRVKPARSRRGTPGVKRQPGAPVLKLASQRELDKLAAVAGLIKWRYADGLQRWMVKRFQIDRVRTSSDAYRVIEGLKKMFENRMKKEFGHDWWARVYDDPGIELYKTEHCPEKYWALMESARWRAGEKKASRQGAEDARKS